MEMIDDNIRVELNRLDKDMVDTNLDQIRILAYESYKALANV